MSNTRPTEDFHQDEAVFSVFQRMLVVGIWQGHWAMGRKRGGQVRKRDYIIADPCPALPALWPASASPPATLLKPACSRLCSQPSPHMPRTRPALLPCTEPSLLRSPTLSIQIQYALHPVIVFAHLPLHRHISTSMMSLCSYSTSFPPSNSLH
ncbi:hypothetical protein K439DRAFT_1643137 [Ramaria rubella]|nr:hypothetical protein K439DRAFT_1643137 [Ramaria rubella]